MPNINIRIKNKIATADRTVYICGNSDYVAVFDFDSEWDAYETKTARFSYSGQYTDVVFTGNQCEFPVISNTFSFNVGVFAGDLHTTTAAYIPCKKSILCGNGTPAAPTEDVYSQIMELLNEAGTVDPDAIAAAVEAYLTENPVEALVTSVNDKTGDVTLTADDVGAIRGKIVSNWDSGNNGDDVYEIIFNYDIGVVQSAPATVFGDNNSAPVLVLVGNQWYGNKDFTAIDRYGRTWYGLCKLSDPSISTFSVHYPTPAEIGAATPEDVTAAAQEAVEASKALGMTGAEVGQIAKITAVDDSGVPTAWEAVDMPSGGGSGDEWELLVTVTAAENTNKLVASFPACAAVSVYFQFGGVEDDLGVIYLIPNANESPYTSEYRAVAAWVTTSASVKRGWLACTLDTRNTPILHATWITHSRSDGSFGDITPGATMNCNIRSSAEFQSSILTCDRYLQSDPSTAGITTFTATGAGMAKGTTMYVYGIRK